DECERENQFEAMHGGKIRARTPNIQPRTFGRSVWVLEAFVWKDELPSPWPSPIRWEREYIQSSGGAKGIVRKKRSNRSPSPIGWERARGEGPPIFPLSSQLAERLRQLRLRDDLDAVDLRVFGLCSERDVEFAVGDFDVGDRFDISFQCAAGFHPDIEII